MEDFPVISEDGDVQLRYLAMRAAGQSHNMAEVLALGAFPGVHGTDAAFMKGRKLGGSQFDNVPPRVGREYLAKAKSAGVNPAGKYYMGSLAREPGDPQAWISGTDDIKRVVRDRGWSCSGRVNVPPPKYADQYEMPKHYKVAEDIVDREVAARVRADPSLAAKKDELKEEVTALRSGRKYGG